MNQELYNFIMDLIEEIDDLQSTVDGEFSTKFERATEERKNHKEQLLETLENFRSVLGGDKQIPFCPKHQTTWTANENLQCPHCQDEK